MPKRYVYTTKTGRPKGTGDYDKRITIWLTKEQYDWLSATAAARGVSMADVVRELITAAMGEAGQLG